VKPNRTLANPLCSGFGLFEVDSALIGNQTRDWPAMACNDDLFALLDTIEQSPQRILSFESSDFVHAIPF